MSQVENRRPWWGQNGGRLIQKTVWLVMGMQQRLDTLQQLGIGPAFLFEQRGTGGRRSGLDSDKEEGLDTLGI
jgi:hypothetical protein